MAMPKQKSAKSQSRALRGKRNAKRKTRKDGGSAISAAPSPAGRDIKYGSRTFAGQQVKLGPRTLDVLPDLPDIRDRMYQPHLRALVPAIYPRVSFRIRNQGKSAHCTGFALAHVVDLLLHRELSPDNPRRVSARMLYEMAKLNDEWEGTAYEGSSARGAIKGFYRNGVCGTELVSDDPARAWLLTYEIAKQARDTRLGAYYRLEPDISDYHAALNEIGVIYISAQIHQNWAAPKNGRIEPGGARAGGHAFAIVGYDAAGFWVLNSWGEEWGVRGIAHWRYSDWAATVMDAWVLQLGVRAPDAFWAVPGKTPASASGLFGFGEPNRIDLLGHFINIDDGRLQMSGKYASPSTQEMQETVGRISLKAANNSEGYDHLVIYAHGGLSSLAGEARRIAVWKRHKVFARNKIYNFHLMWGSDFIGEVFGEISKSPAAGRAAGIFTDWIFDAGFGKNIGARTWRNMKGDCKTAFSKEPGFLGGGLAGLEPLFGGLDAAVKRPILHLVGHSAGAVMLGYMLSAMSHFNLKNLQLGSIHLMAPACMVSFFKDHYGPYLAGSGALKLVDKIYLYNLTDELERDDTVSSDAWPLLPSYSDSLLYLVSRAYEEVSNAPLAGMAFYSGLMPKSAKLEIAYAGSDSVATKSRRHGDFDNDVATMTTIMRRIVGGAVKAPTDDELKGY